MSKLKNHETTKEQEKLIKKGLPKDFLDNCKYCNGSGDDGGGYGACPDCQSTGMKYGQQAWDYLEEDMDKAYRVNQTMIKTLCIEYGFGRESFIPRETLSHFIQYFKYFFEEDDYLNDVELVKKTMLEELPPGGLFPDVVVGYITKSGELGVFLEKSKETELLKNNSNVNLKLHWDGFFKHSDFTALRKQIPEFNEARFETYQQFRDELPVRFEFPFSSLVKISEEIHFEIENY